MSILSADEAVRVCVNKQFPYLRILPESIRIRLVAKLYKVFFQTKYQGHFKQRNSDLLRSLDASLDDSGISKEHQKKLMRWYLALGAQKEFFEDRLSPDDYVIFCEGFISRSANLFISENSSVDEAALKRVLKWLPNIHLAFSIHVETAVCTARMIERGRTYRLRDKNMPNIRKFMENSNKIIGFLESDLTRRGAKVIRIDNNDSFESIDERLREVLNSVFCKEMSSTTEKQGVTL